MEIKGAEKMSQENKRSPQFWLCVCIVLILISCIGASVLQTNFGSVRIIDLNIGTDHQQTMHALMFIPKSASAQNKLPVVITSHGWLNTGEVQDAASIELSRRGVVVLAMDAYSHGMSSNIYDPEGRSVQSAYDAMGMIALVEYVASGVLDYVDTSRIGVMGHSMGGSNSWTTIRHYGRLYNEAISQATASGSPGGATVTAEEQAYAKSVNKVFAAFPTGSTPSADPAVWAEIHCNVGDLYGGFEEGGYRTAQGTPFLTPNSPEGLMMVNSARPANDQLSSIELGTYYGNKADGTLRVIYQPEVTHPWIHFSSRATADVIEYFTNVFSLQNALPKGNQIWNIKEFFNLIGFVAIFILLVPLAKLLMKIPVFASLAGQEPAKLPALTASGKKLFWGGWVIAGVVSFLTAVITMPLYKVIPPLIPARIGTPSVFFGASTTNIVMVWAVLNGIFGLIWFWTIYKKINSQNGVTEEMIGWKIDKKGWFKTLGLAVTIIALVYAIVALARWAFMADFRIWTPALKTFRVDKLLTLIPYLPFYFLFYLANSLAINGAMRVEGMNEKLNMFVCALGNIIGATVLWAIQYGANVFRADRNVIWGPDWIGVLVIAFAIPQLFVAAYLSRFFFKATGKVWLGAMVNTIIMVMMGVMHNCITGIFV
jgi:dienelactone hydrolase